MPGDGSLIRVRKDVTIYFQRVTNPGSGSTYSSWTNWGAMCHAVACCAFGANVWVFYIHYNGPLWRRDSTDNGASFGAPVNMGDISGDATFRLAACAKSETEALVLYSNGTSVYRRRLSGGTWEAAAAWTNSMNSITGLAVTYMGDWSIIITGTEATTTKPIVCTCVLGDGYSAAVGNWS